MVSSNVLYATQADAHHAPTGELSITLCTHCGFVFNATFDLALVPYGQGYDNDQSQSGRFRAHMQEMAGHVRAAHTQETLRVVEIGCGQGQFLSMLIGEEVGAIGAGFDPSHGGAAVSGCEFYREFFGPTTAPVLKFKPNIIVSRHVIEHVPWPSELLRDVRSLIGDARDVAVYFETPSISWIFDHNAFWDLCYEHCSYFCESSVSYAFETAGLRLREVVRVFDGQYLWIEAQPGERHPFRLAGIEPAARRFVETLERTQRLWRERLTNIRNVASGGAPKVAVWGAATKGATFVQDVDPRRALVACLIDINPRKQQHYVPITGHPVVDWQSAIRDGVRTIVVSNPAYLQEIKRLMGPYADDMEFLML